MILLVTFSETEHTIFSPVILQFRILWHCLSPFLRTTNFLQSFCSSGYMILLVTFQHRTHEVSSINFMYNVLMCYSFNLGMHNIIHTNIPGQSYCSTNGTTTRTNSFLICLTQYAHRLIMVNWDKGVRG